MAAGVPAEDLEGLLDMNDEELMAWMDQMGLDANEMFGGDQWDMGDMDWGFGDLF